MRFLNVLKLKLQNQVAENNQPCSFSQLMYFFCVCLIFVVSCFPANPPPEIIWLHNGKEIQETEDFHFEKKGNEYSLYIQEVFPEDTGKYTCEAWNELGETRTQATLTVQGIELFSTLGSVKRK